MSGYKHHYFDLRAMGEVSRLAFAAANIDFEDVRFQWNSEEWAKEKACEYSCTFLFTAYMRHA